LSSQVTLQLLFGSTGFPLSTSVLISCL
jgi:hypothetical protein